MCTEGFSFMSGGLRVELCLPAVGVAFAAAAVRRSQYCWGTALLPFRWAVCNKCAREVTPDRILREAHHFVDMPLWRVVLFRGKGNGASICGMCMDQKSKFCVALRLVSRAALHSCLLEYPYELIAGVAFWDISVCRCWIPCKTCLRMNVSCTVVQSICGTRQDLRSSVVECRAVIAVARGICAQGLCQESVERGCSEPFCDISICCRVCMLNCIQNVFRA